MLEISGISKTYRHGRAEVAALVDVSLRLARGETLGIVGESGSGKSTLARIATGLVTPDAGRVVLRGADFGSLKRREMRAMRRIIQIVFQDPFSSLDPRQRIGAALEEVLAVHGIGSRRERRDRADDMLRRVGLDPAARARYPHQFSGGQRQRIAIARALVLGPEVLICDEPVSALDVSIQAQILNLLARLRQEFNLTILFISHDLSVVAHLADRIGVMYAGRLVELGPSREVFGSPKHPYTQQLLASVPRLSSEETAPAGDDLLPSAGEDEPSSPTAGACPYYTRCNLRSSICSSAVPPLSELGDGTRQVACHHVRAPIESDHAA